MSETNNAAAAPSADVSAADGASAWKAPSGTPVPSAPQPAGDRGDGIDGMVESIRDAISGIDDRLQNASLPFDSVRTGLEWWYRPLIEAKTWIALGYLFVGLLVAGPFFAAIVLIVSVTFVLSFIGVGLLLVVPAFAAINGLARVERARAGWVGDVIPLPAFAALRRGLFGSIGARLGDGARWRQVLFFGLFLVAGPVFFAAGVAPWGFLVGNVFGANFDANAFSVFGLVFAAILAGAAPRATLGVAWVARAFTAALLGPGEAAELQERVTELSGQREQILEAVAEERRRIERNLHDGVQQQLVALGIDIGRANARLESDPDGARELLDDAREKVRGSIGELRLIGRGLHPAVLEDRGLDAALSAVVANAPIPIVVEITSAKRLPEDVASTAYYIANEAVANILKHAHARTASIRLDDIAGPAVRLTIHDDGRGGADLQRGSGLAGMRARVEGVDGTFHVGSPAGGPTTLVAVLPIADRPDSREGRGR